MSYYQEIIGGGGTFSARRVDETTNKDCQKFVTSFHIFGALRHYTTMRYAHRHLHCICIYVTHVHFIQISF